MNFFIEKTPFLRLLIPVLIGILLGDVQSVVSCIIVGVLGIIVIGFSFFIRKERQYAFRWVFGCGVFALLIALSSFLYRQQTKDTTIVYSDAKRVYCGVVQDIPQKKSRSVACNIKTSYPERKNIVLYIQTDSASNLLHPGDEVIFYANLQPFRNLGNPDDFDYKRLMQIRGFAASAYVARAEWKKTGNTKHSLYTLSQHIRKSALDFYRSLQLDRDAYSFVAALTLGFKAELSEDIRQSFRVSGTAHVLAVSGLHMLIIYSILKGLLSVFNFSQKLFRLKYLLIIPLLWTYVFISGVSPSATRAAIMLTMFCLSIVFGRKGFSYNTFAAAAFLMLLYNPMNLFDIGFQMSFAAVTALLYFLPIFNRLFSPTNKYVRYVWSLFTISLAAQLGVFPIVLYYFGTFPMYFFIANLFIVPLIGVIIYACIPVLFFSALKQTGILFFEKLSDVLVWILQQIIDLAFLIVQCIESLPFAEITDNRISAIQALLLFAAMFFVSMFFIKKKAQLLIVSQLIVVVFIVTQLQSLVEKPQNRIVIFNAPGKSDIGLFVNKKRIYPSFPENGFISHPSKRILRLSENLEYKAQLNNRFSVDVLVLSFNRNISIHDILSVFQPQVIVLDSSFPRYQIRRILAEGEKFGVSIHDVSQMGAYSIFF